MKTASLPTKEFEGTPTPSNYGPSVYVASRLPNDLASLEAAKPAWKGYGVARFAASALRKIGVDVRYSSHDCQIAELKPAHASLLDISSREMRDKVVGVFQANLERGAQ
ncbi:MAG: hypothetical protein IPG50_21705 [Myxococcales bacterium]|nr:hypothetical protein [Myxococcales bacterium]